MSRLGLKRFSIKAPFATRQCGHLSQTELISTYHDDIMGRAIYIEDNGVKILHLSLDLLAFGEKQRHELEDYLKVHFGDIHLITSATHTHYANDVRDERYVAYLMDLLKKELIDIKIEDHPSLMYTYKTVHFDEVGKSRISGYESGNEYLTTVKINSEDKTLACLVVYNCHPTILDANVPYFSSEFPGYVLKKLSEAHPDTFFTYMSGAMGDISTRFTRPSQDYKGVEALGDLLYQKIDASIKDDDAYHPLRLLYREVFIPYHHTYEPIDETKIRSDLTQRELDTIKNGQIMRSRLDPKDSLPGAEMGILDLGEFRFIFYPNEIFSSYLDDIDISNTILVSYSNGYGPYILPIGFPYVTYEMFIDTLDDDTKRNIERVLRETK